MRLRIETRAGAPALALQVSPADLTRLALVLASLNALLLLAAAIPLDLLPEGEAGRLGRYALRQLDLRTERKLAVWYASLLLLGAAGAFLLAYAADRCTGRPIRLLERGWLVVASGFLLLSLDEAGGLHEAVGRVEGLNLFAGRLRNWVGVFALPLAVAAALLAAFAVLRLREQPRALMLFGLGLLLFATVPIQEWVEQRMRASAEGEARPAALAFLEEGTELFGSLCFLLAGLAYAIYHAPQGRLVLVPVLDAALARRWMALGVANLAAGLLVVEGLLPRLGLGAYPGDPAGWFAALLALGGAGLGAAAWRARGERSALLLAVASLLLAADLGSGQALTSQLWAGSPRRVAALRVGLAAGVLVLGCLLARGRTGWVGLAWGLLAAGGLAVGMRAQALALFSAYGLLLLTVAPGLTAEWVAKGSPHPVPPPARRRGAVPRGGPGRPEPPRPREA